MHSIKMAKFRLKSKDSITLMINLFLLIDKFLLIFYFALSHIDEEALSSKFDEQKILFVIRNDNSESNHSSFYPFPF